MDVSVRFTVGTFEARVKVTDTGPDGLHDAIDQCHAKVLAMVGQKAITDAAASVWMEQR